MNIVGVHTCTHYEPVALYSCTLRCGSRQAAVRDNISLREVVAVMRQLQQRQQQQQQQQLRVKIAAASSNCTHIHRGRVLQIVTHALVCIARVTLL